MLPDHMQTKLELYQKVTPLARLGIWERNLNTGEVFWNEVMRDIYEVPEDFCPVYETTLDFYNDRLALTGMIENAIKTGQPATGDFLIRTARSRSKWVKVRIHARYDGDNNCISTFGTLEDITDQQNMMKLLEENEQRFHQAFDNAPIGMAIVGIDGTWIKVNKSLVTLLGYSEEEFKQRNFQDFTHPDDLNQDLSYARKLLEGEIISYNMEKRYYHKNGSLVWAHLSVSLVRSQQGLPSHFISQILNMTDRHKQGEILLLERQRLDNIIKSTRVGTWEWDMKTDFMTCNQRAADILGYERAELHSGLLKTWQRLIHPRDMDIFDKELQICFRKERKYFAAECRMRHKSGKWLWIEIRGKVINWDGQRPLFMLGTFANINERKILEFEREQTLKIIREQNSRLLNFAHIVSHNLRSHTGNIQMLLEVIGMEEDEAEKKKLFEMLMVNTTNLQETLSHLNDVVRITDTGSQNVKRINPLQEIKKVIASLSQSILSSGAQIGLEVDPELNINYDASYFESILLNLISNSIKYRDPGRQLSIQISCKDLGKKHCLMISDNGLGIDLEKHGHKVFGMYKTFHGNKDARGIGLFLVKNQIDAMGGKIEIESKPGSGTRFIIDIT